MLLLVLAACGRARSDASPPVPACTTPGFSGSTVRVGLVYPDTGPLALPFSLARSGFEARIALANEAGGVHGRRIEAVPADDAAQKETNLAVAQRLIERENIFVLAEFTTAASGSADLLAANGIPVLGVAAEQAWSNYENMFAATYIYASEDSVTTFGVFARAQGVTRAAVVEDPVSDSAQVLGDQMVASMRSQGVDVVSRIPYRLGATSAARTVKAIRESGADGLIVSMELAGLRELLVAAQEAGVGFKMVLSPLAYDRSVLAADGQHFAGVSAYFVQIPWESKDPALKTYRDAMGRFAPQVSDPDQNLVLNSYITADMLLRGLELAGPCPTRASFQKTLRGLTDYDAAGLIPGGVDFSTNRTSLSLCYRFATVNEKGTAFESRRAADGTERWCGTRLTD
ncbi:MULTISPECIES: ABC transporter substrate-binding protein [Parafrankia]|uniref:ABC transporter substrate-binding protein n=1 Tax=Parafrankia TaxID=2994362 RepID=UPI000AAD29EE|nr:MULTISPECIES: ABC transporter substrate-binding protein [Parafrankia]MBE3200859.1 ABC transporter substrate-binding protein [Parafrankia sp. CH37]